MFLNVRLNKFKMVNNFNGCRVHYLEVYTLKTLHLPSKYGGLNFSVCWDCKFYLHSCCFKKKIIPWCRYLKKVHKLDVISICLKCFKSDCRRVHVSTTVAHSLHGMHSTRCTLHQLLHICTYHDNLCRSCNHI